MPRIRSIKPSVVKHEGLYDLEVKTKLPIRFAWVALWTVCDREGRFLWRPRTLKTDVLPYDPIEFGDVLDALRKAGFVERYEVDGEPYGRIPSWQKHQKPNPRERASELPGPDGTIEPRDAGDSGGATPAAKKTKTAAGPPMALLEEAVRRYNLMAKAHGLPRAVRLSDQRKKKLRARLKDVGLDGWQEALDKLPRSPFLIGNNDRGWRADLDFLLQDKSFNRVIEGYYERASDGTSRRNQQGDPLKTWAEGHGIDPEAI